MKKILLTVAGSMFIALAAVNAQERSDTTKSKDPSSEYRKSSESGTQAETGTLEGKSGTQGQMNWRDEDRESITREDLPEDLVSTLEAEQYKGWESATIYRHKTSSEYMLVLQENGEVKTFYFDKEGKALDYGNVNDPQQSAQYKTQAEGEMEMTEDDSTSNASTSATDVTTSGKGSNATGVTGTESTTPASGAVSVTAQVDQPQWRKEDKVKITTNQIPSPMLITLGDPMYKGWDKSKVYRNKSTNDYMIEITEGKATRTYYFDKSGNAMKYNTASQETQPAETQSSSSYKKETKQEPVQTTTSGAIGTSQVGDDEDAVNDSDDYTLNRASTQGPVATEQPSEKWRAEDRVVVTSTDVPASLRVTLGDDKYKGWENSTIYRNRTNDEYMIEIRDGSNMNVYYFDNEGNQITTSGDEVKTDDNEGAGRSGYSSTEQKIKPTWRTEDKVVIMATEVPQSLRITLADDKYKGWENSTIYRNRSTNEYLVEIRDGSDVTTYYFDRDGKAIVLDDQD